MRTFFLMGSLVLCLGTLFACTSTTSHLPTALVARMDYEGAQVNPHEALKLVNQYRLAHGQSKLVLNSHQMQQAQNFAQSYAKSGIPIVTRANDGVYLFSAGYTTFAQVFSGWRGSKNDAQRLNLASAKTAGIASVFNPKSKFGTHWVMVLGY